MQSLISSIVLDQTYPLMKKTGLNPYMMQNYRPVSNLGFVKRMLERVGNYMQKKNLNDQFQSVCLPSGLLEERANVYCDITELLH